MKRHFLSFLSFSTLLACAAVASAAVLQVARGAFDCAVGFLCDVLAIDFKRATLARPMVALVQAREFVTNLAKRDRPTVMARWRMCPST